MNDVTTMSVQAILILVSLTFIVGTVFGFVIGIQRGVRRGRDIQYVDDFIERGRRECSRHGRDGQFIAIKGRS